MTAENECTTCRYGDLPTSAFPCRPCLGFDRWAPMAPPALPLAVQRAAESAMYQALNTDLTNAFKAPQAAPLDSLDAMEGVKECPDLKPLTGGSSDYYKVSIADPTTPGTPAYTAECNDIIEALKMDYALGNIFKAVWRIAKSRLGSGKSGTTTLYDAEKVAFFGNRLVTMEKAK